MVGYAAAGRALALLLFAIGIVVGIGGGPTCPEPDRYTPPCSRPNVTVIYSYDGHPRPERERAIFDAVAELGDAAEVVLSGAAPRARVHAEKAGVAVVTQRAAGVGRPFEGGLRFASADRVAWIGVGNELPDGPPSEDVLLGRAPAPRGIYTGAYEELLAQRSPSDGVFRAGGCLRPTPERPACVRPRAR